MRIERREDFLKLAVGVVVGLFLLDRMVLSPAFDHWKDQGERIDQLRQKVTRGRQLLDRESTLRARWAEMLKTDLATDSAVAEKDAYAGLSKWTLGKGVSITSLTPQWRLQVDDAHDLYEFRALVNGTQASIGRFVYELETDPLPVRMEDCELTARDAKGQQLSATLRFSFVRLREGKGKL